MKINNMEMTIKTDEEVRTTERLLVSSHLTPHIVFDPQPQPDAPVDIKDNYEKITTEWIQIEFLPDQNLGTLTAMLSNDAFGEIWDNPEEDEAWKDL